MHLKEFGWEPIILTVHEQYYEQALDKNLEKLLPEGLRIEKVSAFKITRPRLIGDIGLRAFRKLYKKGKELIEAEKIDFLYITIPSFYCSMLGRLLHKSTGIPYGIDYQDPWVHEFPGSDSFFSRHWFATKVSQLLEPFAVKNASLITGVSEAYYKDVAERNPHLFEKSLFADLPIGTEPSDHERVASLHLESYLFKKESGKTKLVYAGTMLPKAYVIFEIVCKVLSENQEKYEHIEIHFIGSGKNTNDPESFNVKPLAEKYGLWEKQIFEYPARIPYLDVLVHLNEADGIFILGSTEIHYSPSKVYQAIVSGKPIFAILHKESTAVDVIKQTHAGITLSFNGENDLDEIYRSFNELFSRYLSEIIDFHPEKILMENLQPYFAKSIAGKLAGYMDQIIPSPSEEKKILIISPHFPPSNLTAVHRARLFAQSLPKFGWTPIILTVDESFYEEKPDYNLLKLVSKGTRIEKVRARKVQSPRIIGDIGLRAFYSTYKRAKQIISQEKIDFLYIIIPSFYGALWGRLLHKSTGIKYGIDYIDPWVHVFPGSDKMFSRAWFATHLSKILEPLAVKKASFISGVAESYYKDIFIRNKRLSKTCVAITLPPAAEKMDFEKVAELKLEPYLFKSKPGKLQLVYAGAMLPKAFVILEQLLSSISHNPQTFEDVEFHFIGTGKFPNDVNGFNIKPMAEKYGLWEKNIFEYPARIPYLDVLVHLNIADGVFILGSTEAHYTPSKVYQAVLSNKPILAILHEASTGVNVIRNSKTGIVQDFAGEKDLGKIGDKFIETFDKYCIFIKQFKRGNIDHSSFSQYSSEKITGDLIESITKIISR